MSDLAETILRKMLENAWWGGGYVSVDIGVVDVRVDLTDVESAYLARLQGEVEAEAEAERARSVSERVPDPRAETPTDG